MGLLSFLRVVAGTLFLMFVPGFAWTWVFYEKEKTGVLERVVYSIALSIALVSIAVFFANRFLGIRVNLLNSFIILVILTALPPVHIVLKRKGLYEKWVPKVFKGRTKKGEV